jgi:succinyl-CoA synthetase alpha subunit
MINKNERVCIQGITGKAGSFHTKQMLEYGTNIVCGISKNTQIKEVHGVKVFTTFKDAIKDFKIDVSVVFVPAPFAKDAVIEAIETGIKKIIIITENIPQHDSLYLYKLAKSKGVKIIGPNCPGIIIPGEVKIGIMPASAFKKGDTAIISKSGTLMYEISNYISENSTGIKIAIGLGGDPITGTSIKEAIQWLIENNIDKIIIIGEVGGNEEIEGVKYLRDLNFPVKLKVFLAGRTAPKGKRMGHAGAIVEGFEGSIEYKEEKLKELGVELCKNLNELIW